MISSSFSENVAWSIDIESHASDQLATYVPIPFFACWKSPKSTHRVNWIQFKQTLGLACRSIDTYESLEVAIVSTNITSSKTFKMPIPCMPTDVEYEYIRAIRLRAERRARNTGNLEDLKNARRAQRHIKRHLDKFSRRCWRTFCERLDPRQPLTSIWPPVCTVRSKQLQKQPFHALTLNKEISENACAEEICMQTIQNTATALTAVTTVSSTISGMITNPLDHDLTLDEFNTALSLCAPSSSPGPDRITYAVLAQ